MARAMGLSSEAEWREYTCPGAYRLPQDPDVVWAGEWQGWDDWLGTPLAFAEARLLLCTAGIADEAAYHAFVREGDEQASRLPAQPDKYYRTEWAGWTAFLTPPATPPPPPPPPQTLPRSPPPVMTEATWPPSGADPTATWREGVDAGPLGLLADHFFESRFRVALAHELGRDVAPARFAGVIALVRAISSERKGAAEVEAASHRVLTSLFPDWPPRPPAWLAARLSGTLPQPSAERVGLLYWFEVLFASPFPAFSARLNAWVTWCAPLVL